MSYHALAGAKETARCLVREIYDLEGEAPLDLPRLPDSDEAEDWLDYIEDLRDALATLQENDT